MPLYETGMGRAYVPVIYPFAARKYFGGQKNFETQVQELPIFRTMGKKLKNLGLDKVLVHRLQFTSEHKPTLL